MLVQNNIGKQIQLYVYNAEEDAVRTVWHRIRLDFRSALPRPAAFFFVLPFSLHYFIVTIFRNDDQVTIVPSNDWGGNGWYSSRNRIPNPLFVFLPPSEHFLIFFFPAWAVMSASATYIAFPFRHSRRPPSASRHHRRSRKNRRSQPASRRPRSLNLSQFPPHSPQSPHNPRRPRLQHALLLRLPPPPLPPVRLSGRYPHNLRLPRLKLRLQLSPQPPHQPLHPFRCSPRYLYVFFFFDSAGVCSLLYSGSTSANFEYYGQRIFCYSFLSYCHGTSRVRYSTCYDFAC
jgi:hypothetical protein